jgi:Spy/CpxP family protein refolding chaperone
MRRFSALPIIAALTLATAALAGPPANTIMKVTPPGENKPAVDPAIVCTHKFQMQVVQLGQLQTSLKLSEAQKPVFENWKKIRLELWRTVPCPPLPMGLDIPAPKRVENQVVMMTATADGLRKELPPTQALYNVLTPEQRAIFDGPMKMPAVPPPAPPPSPAGEKPQPPQPAGH